MGGRGKVTLFIPCSQIPSLSLLLVVSYPAGQNNHTLLFVDEIGANNVRGETRIYYRATSISYDDVMVMKGKSCRVRVVIVSS